MTISDAIAIENGRCLAAGAKRRHLPRTNLVASRDQQNEEARQDDRVIPRHLKYPQQQKARSKSDRDKVVKSLSKEAMANVDVRSIRPLL
jgi:hypothetical protein